MATKEVELKSTRRSAHEILEQVVSNGKDELSRSTHALIFSGVAGGMTMGLTGLGVAVAQATLGEGLWQEFVAHLIYPIGFICVIIGRAQLFTENTLYPVIIVLDEPHQIGGLLRLWAAVFFSNVFGALVFASLAELTPALNPAYGEALMKLGLSAAGNSIGYIFWSGVIGGLVVALLGWVGGARFFPNGQVVLFLVVTF